MHELRVVLFSNYQFASLVLRDFIRSPSETQNALWVKHKTDTPPSVCLFQSTVNQLAWISGRKAF